ncbi:hypothetical protein SDRG_02071 [Saprolegnia diclina VS20]|uniref:Uncharacterized protein n=1 Tax=Saprolegnia diclina (strain VS20) TaxID=1156394 RepID=T0S7H0_SAPDV|nr:hypothetical protein SDRG_02071 [Saprolegnia diclina VS20]EQC41013.1 hypothetical protein SDRG_02071 [Saprolegnia diclina VS20]|eukprot:XP_008605857.1 hypothetical protein SDRG_02071 [Saprolegnia diclina VS20]
MVLYDPQYHQKRAAVLAQRKWDEEDALMRKPTRQAPSTTHDARRTTFVPPPQALPSAPIRTTPIRSVKAGRTCSPDAPLCNDWKQNAAYRLKKERISHYVPARNSPTSSGGDDGRALKSVQYLTAQITALEASLRASRDAAAAAALAHDHELQMMHAAHQAHIKQVQASCSATRVAAEAALGNSQSTRHQLVHDVHSAYAKNSLQSDKANDALNLAQRDAKVQQLQSNSKLSGMTLEDVAAQHEQQLAALAAKHKAAQDDAMARQVRETNALRAMFQSVLVARDAAAKAAQQRKRRATEKLHAQAVADLEADLAQVHRASADVVRRHCLEHDQAVREIHTAHAMELETTARQAALQGQVQGIESVAAQLLLAQDECKRMRLALHRTVLNQAAKVAAMWICVRDDRDEMECRLRATEEASAQREIKMAKQHTLEVQRLQTELDRADAAHTADLALHAEAVEAMDDLYQSTVAGHEATTRYLEWQLQTVTLSFLCRT